LSNKGEHILEDVKYQVEGCDLFRKLGCRD